MGTTKLQKNGFVLKTSGKEDQVYSCNAENCYGIDMNLMLIVIEKCYHLQIIKQIFITLQFRLFDGIELYSSNYNIDLHNLTIQII